MKCVTTENDANYDIQPMREQDTGQSIFVFLVFSCSHRKLDHTFLLASVEPILPIRRIRKLRRAPETPGGPLALKDVLILVSFLSLAVMKT